MSSLEKTTSNIFRNTLSPFLRKEKPSRDSIPSEAQYLENVSVSTTVIRFQFRGAHNQYLYNRDLRITNRTGGKISFNIKSNNPENYEVIPCRESLADGKSCEIRIRLALDNRNHSKYNLDRFLIKWGRHDQNELNVDYSESLQLQVKVEQENITQRQIDATHREEQDLILYNQLLKKNKQKIKKLDEVIVSLQQSPQGFVIPRSLIIFVGLLSFLLGYFIM